MVLWNNSLVSRIVYGDTYGWTISLLIIDGFTLWCRPNGDLAHWVAAYPCLDLQSFAFDCVAFLYLQTVSESVVPRLQTEVYECEVGRRNIQTFVSGYQTLETTVAFLMLHHWSLKPSFSFFQELAAALPCYLLLNQVGKTETLFLKIMRHCYSSVSLMQSI